MFDFRHRRTAADLARHAGKTPMSVAVTGASGMVGSALCDFLGSGGNRVIRLVRRDTDDPDEVTWNPGSGRFDAERLVGVDAVVHLAGERIAAPWTADKKRRIRDSRVVGTQLLAEGLATLEGGPRILVSGSAIGFYGDRGDEELTEQSSAGTGFLAEVATDWENAAQPAVDAGIRVVNLRTGLVIDAGDGMLKAMLPAARMGLGGPLGDGRQYYGWIALDDLIYAIHFALYDDGLRGPINGTAPRPVMQRDFAATLGKVLHRPAMLPAPAFAIRALFREMGQALMLDGQRPLPAVLLERGFVFQFPELEAALRNTLGRET